jgi:hypothetical protein
MQGAHHATLVSAPNQKSRHKLSDHDYFLSPFSKLCTPLQLPFSSNHTGAVSFPRRYALYNLHSFFPVAMARPLRDDRLPSISSFIMTNNSLPGLNVIAEDAGAITNIRLPCTI